MRNVDETTHFFFGSLNILRIRNIFVVLVPITSMGAVLIYKNCPHRSESSCKSEN